jgi:hypothetical protein
VSVFTLADFTESLARVPLERSSIARVSRAVGCSPEDFGSWEGGFVLELRARRWAFLFGWCDTTGWGCQDGAYLAFFRDEPTIEQLEVAWLAKMSSQMPRDWAEDPIDLNLWLADAVPQDS